MARKATPTKSVSPIPVAKPATAGKAALVPSAAPVVSAVRNSPIPKVVASAATAKKEITSDMIARRAFEISQSPAAGTEIDNWLRAETELRRN